MKLKQIFKSKRGVAIENAILFMIVIFFLCALITSVTLIGHYQVKIEKLSLEQDVEIEQIGEDYLASVKAGTAFELPENSKYACEVKDNVLTVWRKNNANKKVLLYVEVEGTGEQANVKTWRYSLPTQTE